MSIIIKELRESTGMTQVDFARAFDIPVSTLRKWEQGEAKPAEYVVKMISRLLPVKRENLTTITCKGGMVVYYDETNNSLIDNIGNTIMLDVHIDQVKKENLPIYVEELFEAYYAIKDKFANDCEYDKREDIIWS